MRLYANNDAANVLLEYAFAILDVAVDLNRDGKLIFSSSKKEDGSSYDLSDQTSPARPYRFWINDDYDVVQNGFFVARDQVVCDLPPLEPDDVNTQQEQACEQWDTIAASSSNTSPFNIKRVESRRDLEDFAPLAIQLSRQLNEELYIRLSTSGGVHINLFKGAWRDDINNVAHAYIYDQFSNSQQTTVANADHGYLFEITPEEPRYIFSEDMEHYFDHDGVGRFIFEGVSESDESCQSEATECYLLVEVFRTGDSGKFSEKLAEKKVFLDLHNTTDFYQTITAGVGADGSSDTNPKPHFPIVDDPTSQQKTHIYSGLFPNAELEEDYTLFVHGWRMTDPEKTSFANTAFKRLYWSGYKGSFGALTWPTGWFNKPAHVYGLSAVLYVLGNEQNYSNSESTARLVGADLANWLENLSASSQYQDIHLLAHSMGNVVVSEALLHYEGTSITSYTATQAAEVGGAYQQTMGLIQHKLKKIANACPGQGGDVLSAEEAWRCYNLSFATPFDMPPDRYRYNVPLIHGATTDANMASLNTGDEYYRSIDNNVDRVINLYNRRDAALNAWEFNQLTKPDYLDGILWNYGYALLNNNQVEDRYLFGVSLLEWHEGQPEKPEDGYESITEDKANILSHIIPSRTHALGQMEVGNSVINQSINLRDPGYGLTSSNQGHSKQFYDTYAVMQEYWKTFLETSLKLTVTGDDFTGLYND
jgi:pimeloyl-ACP methyl ester carboxylesterase